MPASDIANWPLGRRDVTNVLELIKSGPATAHESYHLQMFLESDGIGWNGYEDLLSIKEKLGFPVQVQNQRLRTYRKFYEDMGIIYQGSGGVIRLSPLGRRLNELIAMVATGSSQEEIAVSRANLVEHAALVLSRYQFNHPTSGSSPYNQQWLPSDFDVMPYFSIWTAMCALDRKIHYEELNRVIAKVVKQDDLEAAIDRIKVARTASGGSYKGKSEDQLRNLLGDRIQEIQPIPRMIALLSPAGFGGLLVESNVRSDGFRHLSAEAFPTIQKTISEIPNYYSGTTVSGWNAHFLSTVPTFTPTTELAHHEHQLAGLPATESLALRKSRIGQGIFRDGLIGLWGGCSVTGINNPDLLTASHLKPWRSSTNSERLDPYNGLLLIPNLDRLVDKGLISFDSKGNPIKSNALTSEEQSLFCEFSDHELMLRGIFPELEKYLEFHRSQVFENWI